MINIIIITTCLKYVSQHFSCFSGVFFSHLKLPRTHTLLFQIVSFNLDSKTPEKAIVWKFDSLLLKKLTCAMRTCYVGILDYLIEVFTQYTKRFVDNFLVASMQCFGRVRKLQILT